MTEQLKYFKKSWKTMDTIVKLAKKEKTFILT